MAQTDARRREPRVDLSRAAVLVNSDAIESDVLILDVSGRGFRLGETEHLKIGELVTLRVEHGQEFGGQILWVLGREAGGVFLAPIGRQ